jgi:hypothetical protein
MKYESIEIRVWDDYTSYYDVPTILYTLKNDAGQYMLDTSDKRIFWAEKLKNLFPFSDDDFGTPAEDMELSIIEINNIVQIASLNCMKIIHENCESVENARKMIRMIKVK